MTGKVKLENEDLVLICGKNKTPLSPNIPQRFLNSIKNYVDDYGHVWVEFTIETLGTGVDEFNVIDQDFALIEKVYNISFGEIVCDIVSTLDLEGLKLVDVPCSTPAWVSW